jgi:hypothetical protein
MLSWKDFGKTGAIVGVINMFFMLIYLFDYSILSLCLLFLFFSSLFGMALNLLYRATTTEAAAVPVPG